MRQKMGPFSTAPKYFIFALLKKEILRSIKPLRNAGKISFIVLQAMKKVEDPGRARLSSSLPTNMSLFDEVMRKKKTPFIIGVCGGTASGKTSVCEDIFSFLFLFSKKN